LTAPRFVALFVLSIVLASLRIVRVLAGTLILALLALLTFLSFLLLVGLVFLGVGSRHCVPPSPV
jgi:hypothetical protein